MARELLDLLPSLRSDEDLMTAACELLDADHAAILTHRARAATETVIEPGAVRARHSTSARELSDAAYCYFRSKLPGCPAHPEDRGYEDAFPLPLEEISPRFEEPTSSGRTAQVLVAFSSQPTGATELYELLVVRTRPDNQLFTSYDAWAASNLLRQFEYERLQEVAAAAQLEAARRWCYAAYAAGKVLVGEDPHSLAKRVESLEPSERASLVAIWYAYHVRARYEAGFKPDALPAVLQKAAQSDEEPTSRLARRLIALLNVQVRTGYGKPLRAFESACESFVVEAGVALDAVQPNDRARQLVSLGLEHAWRVLRDVSLHSVYDHAEHDEPATPIPSPGIGPNCTCCMRLLDLTARVTRSTLVLANPEGHLGGLTLDRVSLRFYFALLVNSATQLKSRYLPQETADAASAAPEMTRQFVLGSSRYMLGVLRSVQDRCDLDTSLPAASEVEVLDALLYLIDRYAIVELGVDDRLPVRELLLGAFSAEARAHPGNSRYREHLTHVLDVFVLGHLLLDTHYLQAGSEEVNFAQGLSSGPNRPSRNSLLKNWAVASLLHDIGYRLPDGLSEGAALSDWSSYFALKGRVTASLVPNATAPQNWNAAAFLRELKSKIDPKDVVKLPDPEHHCRDHGLLSAYRVGQLLARAGQGEPRNPNADGGQQPGGAQQDTTKLVKEYGPALHAIAHHNLFSHGVALGEHPLTCLLRLCDELQEWGRRRMNVERVVKHLYLALEGDDAPASLGHPSLEGVDTNFRVCAHPADAACIKIVTIDKTPHFRFSLRFRNPADAGLDALTTVLSKAHNLQGISLAQTHGALDMTWSLELRFPRPKEYGKLTEYDVYGLYVDKPRPLPLMRSYPSLETMVEGLGRIQARDGVREDCFGIVVGASYTSGRLKVDPSDFFDELVKFKEQTLRRGSGTLRADR